MNSFIQGILIGILIYSSIIAIFIAILIDSILDAEHALIIVSGPIGWITYFIILSYHNYQSKKWIKEQDEIRKEYERNRERSKGN